jgi:hypothetical protein
METIRSLDKDLWVIDHDFVMPGGIALGARMTIIRLADGGLWLHSPVPLTSESRAWLAANGPVRAIVAPNLLHHFYLADAAKAFPDAEVYGPPGLAEKISEIPGLRVIDPVSHPWQGDLGCLAVEGCPRMNELVFHHPNTRTLVLTDLAFNVQRSDSLITRIFLRINGVLGRFGPSRLARSFFFGDPAQVRKAVEEILIWDFDRVIVSHGEVLESGGNDALREGFGWLLQ